MPLLTRNNETERAPPSPEMLSKISFVARLSPLEDVPPDEKGRHNEIITYNNYQTQELQDYTLTLSLIIVLT